MLCDAFISVLRSGREDFNRQFAHARREHPALDAAAWSSFVASHLNPLVQAVAAVAPNAVVEVATTAWEIGLGLVGQRLAGPQAKDSSINQTWSSVFVTAAALVAQAPARIIASLSNAASNLGVSTPLIGVTPVNCASSHTVPTQWIPLLESIALVATNPDDFLAAAQVAAWRSGLAHFRPSALAKAQSLPPALALTALDAAGQDWNEIYSKLMADPWFTPAQSQGRAAQGLRVGAFRGFGGQFTVPPVLSTFNEQIFVRSGDDVWLLVADAFGATLHRATAEEFALGGTSPTTGNPLPANIGSITSVVRTSTTLAVTGSLTHAVLLSALPSSP
jgi:hypothetical protein